MGAPSMQVRIAMEEQSEADIPGLSLQAGLSMEWLAELCCTPLFYYRCASRVPSRSAQIILWSMGRHSGCNAVHSHSLHWDAYCGRLWQRLLFCWPV